MYYFINVDYNSMAAHLTRSDWRVLRSAVHPQRWLKRVMIYCRMTVKKMQM